MWWRLWRIRGELVPSLSVLERSAEAVVRLEVGLVSRVIEDDVEPAQHFHVERTAARLGFSDGLFFDMDRHVPKCEARDAEFGN